MYPQRARAFRRGFLAAAAIAGVLTGGVAAEAKTFKWAFQGDVQTLDPHGLFETFTLGFLGNVYEGLGLYKEAETFMRALSAAHPICGCSPLWRPPGRMSSPRSGALPCARA